MPSTQFVPPAGLESENITAAEPAPVPRVHRINKKKGGFFFVLPALVFIFAFMLYPLGYSGYLSLTKYNFVYSSHPTFIGFQNYIAAFQDDQFIKSLTNSVVYAAFYFPLVMLLSLVIALMLFQKLRFSSFFRSAIFVPIVVPLSLVSLVFVWILQPNFGLLNYVLGSVLHLPFLTYTWLGNGTTAMAAIVMVSLWANIGFITILFLAGLQSLSSDMLEAAEVDGAGALKKIFYVVLPNLREYFFLTGTFSIITALKVFVEPMVITSGGPGVSTLMLYEQIYNTAFTGFRMGYASAMGYILGALILVLVGMNFLVGRIRRSDIED